MCEFSLASRFDLITIQLSTVECNMTMAFLSDPYTLHMATFSSFKFPFYSGSPSVLIRQQQSTIKVASFSLNKHYKKKTFFYLQYLTVLLQFTIIILHADS